MHKVPVYLILTFFVVNTTAAMAGFQLCHHNSLPTTMTSHATVNATMNAMPCHVEQSSSLQSSHLQFNTAELADIEKAGTCLCAHATNSTTIWTESQKSMQLLINKSTAFTELNQVIIQQKQSPPTPPPNRFS